MTTITKLTKTNLPYHPALGHIFVVELSNGESFDCYEDELMDRFGYERVLNNFQELVGESWESE